MPEVRCRATRAQRKYRRVPMQARSLFAAAAAADDECNRLRLREEAWKELRRHQRSEDDRLLRKKVSTGRAVSRSKKLHVMSAIDVRVADQDPPCYVTGEAEACAALSPVFEKRWGAGSLHRESLLTDTFAAFRSRRPTWTGPEMMSALACIRRKSFCDHLGECAAMWVSLFRVVPEVVCDYFAELAADDQAARSTVLRARAYGKSSGRPRPSQVRIVIPLTARAQILDALIAHRLHAALSHPRLAVEGFFVGAVPRTQPLDIAFSCAQVVERACDDFSRGALAQFDIHAYYDSLDLLLVVTWLTRHIADLCDPAVAVAALRWQMLPSIVVDAHMGSFEVARRTVGSLTGSRTAGALGRVPVEQVMRSLADRLNSWGFDVGRVHNFVGASFVDNLYFASHSTGGALSAAELFATSLRRDWKLTIKPGSRVVMPVAGSPDWENIDDIADAWPDWKFSYEFPCLGHVLAADSSAHACFAAAKASVLAAVARNFSRCSKRALGVQRKRILLDRVARSVIDFRCSRWPVSPSLSRALDSLQRRCIATIINLPREPGDDMNTWQRRRSRHAGLLARSWGTWSDRHLARCRSWHEHLHRDRNASALPAIILLHKGQEWRCRRRLAMGSSRSDAGRLASRVLTHVHPRWEDSLQE